MSIRWTTLVIAVADVIALSAVLLAIGLRNPRLMFQDYPKDVQAAVPPKTTGERRETRWWGILERLSVNHLGSLERRKPG